MLKVTNLRKYFGGVKAVNGCSFEIEDGSITALIGPNGSGKSTVFNLLSGILKADSGKVVLNKRDIVNLPPEKISNLGLSRLFQQSRLFGNLTVKDNLLLATSNEDTKLLKNLFGSNRESKAESENVLRLLRLVKMEEYANHLARDLSYGQKRLIEVLRATLNPHQLLILDEPVAGVTQELRATIARLLLDEKNSGKTILLIEHDMAFAFKVSDWVVVVNEGRVIAEGKPGDIKNNRDVLEAYLGN
jgi:branched-chain amino acid transport system ATP-binding protein